MNIRKILMTLLVLVFGLIPSLLLFIWIERNTALPWIGSFLMTHGFGLPWIYVNRGLTESIVFNLGLIAIFGVIHSGLAGRKSISRPVYVIFSGLSALLILLFWQPTGIVLYQLIPSAVFSSTVSLLLYWGLTGFAVKSLTGVDGPAQFIMQKNTADHLQTGGLYARVRHPAYFFTLAAWFITPMMSLDRLVFSLGMLAYLFIGIRLEERKLLEKFGDPYRLYREKTPMLLPKLVRSIESIP